MKHFWLIISLCLAIGNAKAQKAVISTQKIYLKLDGKVTDSLMIPVVSARYPALKRALTDSLIFDGQDIKEIIDDYSRRESSLTSLDHQIVYQNKRVISLKITYETMGAYPDSYQKWLNFDIITGKPRLLSAELNQVGVQKLLATYKVYLKKEMKYVKMRMDGEIKESINEVIRRLTRAVNELKVDNLQGHYLFTAKGILVTSERVLPHVIQALDLDRDLLVPYSTLSKYKKPDAVVIR